MKRLLGFGAAIGALTWFFDPQNGARRRNMTRDRFLALFRQGGRKAGRAGRAVAAEAHGLKQKATHLREEEKPQPDDITLARKVETEIFRDADAPKGAVNVHAVNGIVELRGQLNDRTQIEALVAKARAVSGVQDVRNLMHLPGETPPNIAGTPGVS